MINSYRITNKAQYRVQHTKEQNKSSNQPQKRGGGLFTPTRLKKATTQKQTGEVKNDKERNHKSVNGV